MPIAIVRMCQQSARESDRSGQARRGTMLKESRLMRVKPRLEAQCRI